MQIIKYAYFLLASFSLITLPVFAQNSPPQVSNVLAQPNTVQHIVTISYDVSDSENDSLLISVRVSSDSGLTFLYPIDSVTGDIGYPILPGTGKQILWHYPIILDNDSILSLQVKIIADDLHPVDIQTIVDQVDSNLIKSTLNFVVGIRNINTGYPHVQEVKDTIEQRFINAGLQSSRQTFTVTQGTGDNILGRHPGLIDEEKTVIVDGHFDTVPISPGADDNGSGTVGMLEAMRVLSMYNFRHTLKFIGFDFEEMPGIIGSQQYVTNAIPSYENIIGVLNHEMIGFYSSDSGSQTLPPGFCTLFPEFCDSVAANNYAGDFIANIANENSNPLRTLFDSCVYEFVPQLRILSLAVPGNGQIAPDLRRSDHAHFWDAGYEALMLTDGANFRNPNYHQPSDTLGTIDFQFMTNVIKAVVATAANLAEVMHGGFAVSNFIDIKIPVELLSFNGTYNNGNVTLHWSTATELNNQGFEVQRSTANSEFERIGFVEGNGTTTETYTYVYTNKNLNSGKYYYRLKQIDFDGSYEYSNVIEVTVGVPIVFTLNQNFPNPFNPSTTIKYSIPEKSNVTLKIYDVLGNEIGTLIKEEKPAGTYEITWSEDQLPSGIYFYRLQAGSFRETKKMILMK